MTAGQYGCKLQDKPWSSSGLDKLIRKIGDTGGTNQDMIQTVESEKYRYIIVVGLYY